MPSIRSTAVIGPIVPVNLSNIPLAFEVELSQGDIPIGLADEDVLLKMYMDPVFPKVNELTRILCSTMSVALLPRGPLNISLNFSLRVSIQNKLLLATMQDLAQSKDVQISTLYWDSFLIIPFELINKYKNRKPASHIKTHRRALRFRPLLFDRPYSFSFPFLRPEPLSSSSSSAPRLRGDSPPRYLSSSCLLDLPP